MIWRTVTEYLKVQVDIEPEDDRASRKITVAWLEWVIDNDIAASSPSSGPSGFVCYVNAAHREAVEAWLAVNIGTRSDESRVEQNHE